jgi:hypothetical protein
MEVLRTLSPVSAAKRSGPKANSLSIEASRSNDQENTPPLYPNLKLSTTNSPRKATTPSHFISKSIQKSHATQNQEATRDLLVSDTDASVKVISTSFFFFFFFKVKLHSNFLHVWILILYFLDLLVSRDS